MASKNIKIPIPLGTDGLVGSSNMSEIPPTALTEALNVSYYGGVISKAGGSAKYNSTAISGTPTILAGSDWNLSGSIQRMIVYTDAGTLLKDSGAGAFATTLKSGLSTAPTNSPMLIRGGAESQGRNRKLFIFNGANPVQVLSGDGTTTTDLASPPADWTGANQPVFGFIHDNRLWGGGNSNDAHRVYYSLAADHEDFLTSDAGSLSIYPGEGEYLVAGVSFKNAAFLFKYPQGIYAVDTTDPAISNWVIYSLTKDVGVAGPDCITKFDDKLLLMDTTGSFYIIEETDSAGQFSLVPISPSKDMNLFVKNNVNLDASVLAKVQSVFYSLKREAHFAVPYLGSSVNNRDLIVDLNRQNPRFRWNDKDTCVSLWLRKNSSGQLAPVCGDNAGFVWKLDQDTKSKDSSGYLSEFRTADTDFSYFDQQLASIRKNGQFLELVFNSVGSWNVDIDLYWDSIYYDTIVASMGIKGEGLGSFTLDTDVLAGAAATTTVNKISGAGRRFSIKVRNQNANEDFSLSKAFIHVTAGDERE